MCHINKVQSPKSKIQKSEGIALLFIVLITSLILSIGLGLTALLIQGMRITGEIGYSVVAFYAADSGIEVAVYDLYQSVSPNHEHSDQSDNVDLGGAQYETLAECCDPDSEDCSLESSEECPSGCPLDCDSNQYINLNCDALNYCLKSAGSYKRVQRAIEIKY